MVYFIQIMYTYACQHCLTTGMRVKTYFGGQGFAEHPAMGPLPVSKNAQNYMV